MNVLMNVKGVLGSYASSWFCGETSEPGRLFCVGVSDISQREQSNCLGSSLSGYVGW